MISCISQLFKNIILFRPVLMGVLVRKIILPILGKKYFKDNCSLYGYSRIVLCIVISSL